MMNDAINICLSGINACFNWMAQIFNSIPGSFQFILAMIGVYTVFRLLLVRIIGARLGAGASDIVKAIRRSDKEKE